MKKGENIILHDDEDELLAILRNIPSVSDVHRQYSRPDSHREQTKSHPLFTANLRHKLRYIVSGNTTHSRIEKNVCPEVCLIKFLPE